MVRRGHANEEYIKAFRFVNRSGSVVVGQFEPVA
jgi:hypothetical protein